MDDAYERIRPPPCPICGRMMTSWEVVCPPCAESLPEPERVLVQNIKPYPEFL